MHETKTISSYKLQLKSKIQETAMKAFVSKGIRAVKMDDVASELGISKRTLYELYENKELLLYEGVVDFHRRREEEMSQLAARCNNVMEIMFEIYRMKVNDFGQTSMQFYADLEKYPKVHRFLNQQNQQMRKKTTKFLERGVAEGYFREDLNYELCSKLIDVIAKYVIENELYRKFDMKDIFYNLVFVFMRGICTMKGVEALDKIVAGI